MGSNLQQTADLFTFTKEILNGKHHFWCSDIKPIIFLNEKLRYYVIVRAIFESKSSEMNK